MGSQDEQYGTKQGRPEQGFFPGLPNDIVLEHIATKVSWKSMFALAAVNSAWRRAIRSREIYNLRKRFGASQMMVVAPIRMKQHTGFFDVESQDVFLFPPPEFLEGAQADGPPNKILYSVPLQGCMQSKEVYSAKSIVFLNDKLYAFQASNMRNGSVVLELDVAACDREWRRCCSCSLHGDTNIVVACNGKIYAFTTYNQRFGGKVFDPSTYQLAEIKDRPLKVWSSAQKGSYFQDDRHLGYDPGRVTVLGTEIFVRYSWEGNVMVFDSVTEKWSTIRNAPFNGIERT